MSDKVKTAANAPDWTERIQRVLKMRAILEQNAEEADGLRHLSDGNAHRVAEFIQKSHIAALDLTCDLTTRWSIGGKYAYRMGQVSLDRTLPVFFDSAAQLGVLRVEWRFRKGWEGLAEVRTLELRDVRQRRRGALTAIYSYIGKNLKVGASYNFTDFSDDLTDLRYNHKGVFVNIIGTR